MRATWNDQAAGPSRTVADESVQVGENPLFLLVIGNARKVSDRNCTVEALKGADEFARDREGDKMSYDPAKFKVLVHYIIWRAGKSDWFGATKLNKGLWFADARQYTLTGRPITGETYTKNEFGPVPRHVMPVRAELETDGAIQITKEGRLTRLVALREPNVEGFTDEELQTVNYWVDHIDQDHTAGTISKETHDYAWEIAPDGAELPLYALKATRIGEYEPTDEDIERLKARAKELDLL